MDCHSLRSVLIVGEFTQALTMFNEYCKNNSIRLELKFVENTFKVNKGGWYYYLGRLVHNHSQESGYDNTALKKDINFLDKISEEVKWASVTYSANLPGETFINRLPFNDYLLYLSYKFVPDAILHNDNLTIIRGDIEERVNEYLDYVDKIDGEETLNFHYCKKLDEKLRDIDTENQNLLEIMEVIIKARSDESDYAANEDITKETVKSINDEVKED